MKRTVGKIGRFLAVTHALRSLRVSHRPVIPSASSTDTKGGFFSLNPKPYIP